MDVKLLALLMFLAFFLEGTIQWFKSDYKKEKSNIVALLGGVLLACVVGFNPLTLFDYQLNPHIPSIVSEVVGWLIVGVSLARGSNHVNTLAEYFNVKNYTE